MGTTKVTGWHFWGGGETGQRDKGKEKGSRRGCPLWGWRDCELDGRGSARFQFSQALGEQGFELDQGGREALDAFAQLVVGHAVFSVRSLEGGLIHGYPIDFHGLG